MKQKLTLLVLIVTLSVYWFFTMLGQSECPRHYDGNMANLYLFARLSSHPVDAPNLLKLDGSMLFPEWNLRPLSQWMTGRLLDWTVRDGVRFVRWNGYGFPNYIVAFAGWASAWLLATLLVIAGFLWRKPMLAAGVILVVYAGLTYDTNIPSGAWFYPWDGPILCLFTWGFLAWHHRQHWQFGVAVLCACAIKETGIMLCLLPFLSLKRKWMIGAVGLGVAGLLIRSGLSHAFFPGSGVIPKLDNSEHGLLGSIMTSGWQNTAEMLAFHLNNFVFCGCGFVVLSVCFARRWRDQVFIGLFILNYWLIARLIEFRDFNELLVPVALVMFSLLEGHQKECKCF